jgi:hypothetical protein
MLRNNFASNNLNWKELLYKHNFDWIYFVITLLPFHISVSTPHIKNTIGHPFSQNVNFLM